MKRWLQRTACGAALTTLTACAAITPVPAGPLVFGPQHQLVLGRQWSDVSAIMPLRAKNVRILTIDGPLLNRLYLAEGLGAGEGLLKAASKEQPAPTFQAKMSPNELVEFVSESVASMGYQRVSTKKLRPAKVGRTVAYRFDLEAQTESGLQLQGTAQVAVVEGKLYVVLYVAPAEHYFAATLPEVEGVMASQS